MIKLKSFFLLSIFTMEKLSTQRNVLTTHSNFIMRIGAEWKVTHGKTRLPVDENRLMLTNILQKYINFNF